MKHINNKKLNIIITFSESLVAALLLFFLPGNLHAQSNSGYHIVKTFHVGGEGWWDYIAVNSDLKRIYVSHASHVNILNETNGDSIGVIPNTEGVHGIAFAEPFNKGYTSNGKSNSVSVFDLNDNRVLKEIRTGKNPDAIIYDSFDKKIFVCDGRSNEAVIIDPSKDIVVASVDLNGKPEAAVSDNKGNVFVNIESNNEIAKINMKKYKIESRWKTGKGESPSGLAIDTGNGILFSGCGNRIMAVLSAEDGKILAELPIGMGCDGVVFDNKYMNAFSSNREGTLTEVHEDSPSEFHVAANIPTKRGARTSAIDEKTHNIFLPTAQFEPPPKPTADVPHPRSRAIPGTFEVLVVGLK